MNYFTLLDVSTLDVSNLDVSTEQIEKFFSREHLTSLLNSFGDWGVSLLFKIILALVIWKVGQKVINLILKINKKALERSSLDVGVAKFIASILRTVLYAVLVLMIVDTLGFQTTSLLTIFGSAALAVGMSLQGSLTNFAGGILLLIFKPFTIGDYIISGSNEGKVVAIEMLYTRLLTIDNKNIMVPNGTLSNSSITNVGAEGIRRLDIEIGISYESDLHKAKQLLTDILSSNPDIFHDREERVIVKELAESCVTLETRVWVSQDKYWDTRFALLEKYKEVFDVNGIRIPYNQLDVNIKQG